jgi:Ca2+-binding RTX toxin-like protein
MATITGTSNFDFLNGTFGDDFISGLGGPDTIFGSRGNDFIDAGDGFDAVDYRSIGTGITLEATGIIRKGAFGTDTLFKVERIIAPTAFASTIDASTATGATAIEVNLGGNFINIYNIPGLGFRGFVVENFVNATGTDNTDTFTGSVGNNILRGLGGNDFFNATTGNDLIDGGTGFDTIDYRSLGTGITLGPAGTVSKGALGSDQLVQVERIIAPTTFANSIDASTATGAASIEVNLGGNFVNIYNIPGLGLLSIGVENFVNATGTNNIDTFTGSSGNNILRGLGGNDFFNATAGNDTIDGGIGFDTIDYRPLNRAVTLLPTGIINKSGGGQDNLIAMDLIIGALGQNNTIDASSAFGSASLNVRLIDLRLDVQNIPGLGARTFFVENFNTIIGTANRDVIDGNDANNIFNGGGGNDDLFGHGGDDNLLGGAGNDFVSGDAGNDRITGSNSTSRGFGEFDRLVGGSGSDRFVLGDRSGSYYEGFGLNDFASISDLGFGDLIELGVGELYRITNQGAAGFDLLTIGVGGSADLVARVSGPSSFGFGTGTFTIASGQSLGGIFVGA